MMSIMSLDRRAGLPFESGSSWSEKPSLSKIMLISLWKSSASSHTEMEWILNEEVNIFQIAFPVIWYHIPEIGSSEVVGYSQSTRRSPAGNGHHNIIKVLQQTLHHSGYKLKYDGVCVYVHLSQLLLLAKIINNVAIPVPLVLEMPQCSPTFLFHCSHRRG